MEKTLQTILTEENINREELHINLKEALLAIQHLWDRLNCLEHLINRNVEQEDLSYLAVNNVEEITEEDLDEALAELLNKATND